MALKYVATTGDDTTGDGSIGNPWKSWKKGVENLAAGDTLYIRGGTYDYDLNDRIKGVDFAASGTSWSNPITISAYPGETVLSQVGPDRISFWTDSSVSYLIIKGTDPVTRNLIFDCIYDSTSVDGVFLSGNGGNHHIRLQDLEVKNSYGNGIFGDVPYVEFINISVNNNGRETHAAYAPGHNGIYWYGDNALLDGGEYWGNNSYGFRFYLSGSGNTGGACVARNFRAYDNGLGHGLGGASDSGSGGGGFVLGDTDQLVYNGLIYNNYWGGEIVNTSLRCKIYNCTFYNNDYGINIQSAAVESEVINNIVVGSTPDIQFSDTTSVVSHNLTTDPSFVDAGSLDFHLVTGSPAIGVGANIPIVATDFDGVSRGTTFDIGAYEYVSVGGTPIPVFMNTLRRRRT